MNSDRCMSLLRVTESNCLSRVVNALPQAIWSQHFSIVLETQDSMHKPVVLGWRAAKTEQSSIFSMRLNDVAEVRVAFQRQYPACREQDAHFRVREMSIWERGWKRFYRLRRPSGSHINKPINPVDTFFAPFV